MNSHGLKTDTGRYTIDYQAELNPQQYQAVTNIDGPQLVIAGAGSGKTRALVYRVAYLVENNIEPRSILLLTFTRKAAQEMMHRAAGILDERCARVSGGTYHSFANLILRRYASSINMAPNFNILDRSDAEDIISMFRKELGLNTKERRFPKKRALMDIFSKSVNKCTTVQSVLYEEYPYYGDDYNDMMAIFEHYRNYKRNRQVMDFDDLLVGLRDLLRENDAIRQTISSSYRYIMVDEFQDTNKIQAEITVLLASEHHNIMAVGDDSQSIYSFRGANFRNIMDFPDLFPGTVITTMEQNYRSTPPILKLTNAVIHQAKEKYSKTLFSDIKGKNKPFFITAGDEYDQADFIIDRIAYLQKNGIPLDKIAVLFRASWFTNELEVELKNSDIPYVKYGGLKFSESAHVKDALAFMRVVNNIYDEVAWLRILQLMDGMGPATAQKIIADIIQNNGDVDRLISKAHAKKKFFGELEKLHLFFSDVMNSDKTPAEMMEAALTYYSPLFETTYDDFRKRKEDLASILRISERYSTLEQMVTDMVLEPPEAGSGSSDAADKKEGKLVLSTIHSAKGLEWHTVFIIHLVDGYFPSVYSRESEDQLEEERRLFYVGATRARRNLFLISPELKPSPGNWNTSVTFGSLYSEPSCFITDIPDFDDLVETISS